jgi:hypothetical protein
MDHAAKIADKQLFAATTAANATKMGRAVVTAIVEVIPFAYGK